MAGGLQQQEGIAENQGVHLVRVEVLIQHFGEQAYVCSSESLQVYSPSIILHIFSLFCDKGMLCVHIGFPCSMY